MPMSNKDQLKQLAHGKDNDFEGPYYYWRQYGNNYLCKFECSKDEYDEGVRKGYCGHWVSKEQKGYYRYRGSNYVWVDCTIHTPDLKYCADTYWYFYADKRDVVGL
mmetsp:Transcript_37799/g.125275  ORF Transcript_37799/g.125275 Transcript_37799/m.125275 type:complete len:106 (+) Transcript_37799:72-389(+)